jgi:hypothetical protein
MLLALLNDTVLADLLFFDGLIRVDDWRMILAVSRLQAVFAFHDYNYGSKIRGKRGAQYLEHGIPRKGIGNVTLLKPHLPHHVLIEPQPGSIIALLVPESML